MDSTYKDYICNQIDSFFNTDNFCHSMSIRDRDPGVRDLFLISTIGNSIGVGLGWGGIIGLSNGIEAVSQLAFDNLGQTFTAALDLGVGLSALCIGGAAVYCTHKLAMATLKEINARSEDSLSFDKFSRFLRFRA